MHPTLLQLADDGLNRNTTGTAIATKRDGRWIETSVESFRRQVEHFALGLKELGIYRGDRVAMHTENCAEFVVADQAILSLGAVSVPIYTTQPAEQIEFILRNAEASAFLVSTEKLFEASRGFIGDVPSIRAVIGIRGRHAEGMLGWDEVLEMGRRKAEENPGLFRALREQVQPDDLATLIYTSGTTGQPKGVMLSHANITSNVLGSASRMPWDVERERGHRVLSYLPLTHILERMACYMYLHIGYPIWFVESVDEMMADLQHVRPIHFSTVPRLLEKIHAGVHNKLHQVSGIQKSILGWGLALADRYDVEMEIGAMDQVQYALADALVFRKLRALFGGNLRAITSGGAALSREVMNFMNAIGIFCGQGYGLSETSPVIAVYTKGKLRAGSVGQPIDGAEVRIAPDGEILTRGPSVMQGYFRNPAATAEVIDAEGWFHTGDVGHLDADGHLFVTDRKKELMKLSTGKYIAPQPIEGRLVASGLVEQAVVLGHSRQFCSALIVVNLAALEAHLAERGQALPAAGDLDADAAARGALQAVVDQINRGLPPWEQIKRFTLIRHPWSIETGELTPTMKIKRRVIHERHAEQIQGMYS